jgi:transposase
MQIERAVSCGVDVHKRFLVAVLSTAPNGEAVLSKPKRFSTFTKGLRSFKAWLDVNNCHDVCMESTGKYWVPVHRIVSDEAHNVRVVNPKYVKAPRGQKNDERDAARIAEYFMFGIIPEYSLIPPADILAIRDVARYRRKVVNTMTAEKNRLSNCLTVSCIKLDEVLSDLHGSKTGKALIEQAVKHGGGGFDPAPYIDRRVKASVEEFRDALDGKLTPATQGKMAAISEHLRFLEKKKGELEQSLVDLSHDYNHQLDIMKTAPGIDTISAISILSETGVDMEEFGSAKRFLSWVGVVPQNNESAGKKKSTRIAKGNAWLKPVLVQCANAAIKDKKHPEIREKYLALKKRRGHKKALVAIAKRLATAIYHMLLKDEPYQPSLAAGAPPNKGTIDLEGLIRHYQLKGFKILADGEALPDLTGMPGTD